MCIARRSWFSLAVLLVLLANLGWAMRETDSESPIDDNERVVFFPTAASQDPAGDAWTVPVHGWIFEPKQGSRKRAALLGVVRVALGLERDADESNIFRNRASAFLVDNERGQSIAVQTAGAVHPLPPSGPNGHFIGALQLPAEIVAQHTDCGTMPLRAVARPGDARDFSGAVWLLEATGVSVISDVDDTVKISEVRDRKALLRRTFTQEFEAAPGMAALYDQWRQRGAAFHYVTAAPWQLYEPLSEFLAKSGYPLGTFDMKTFRLKDRSVTNLWADADVLKRKAILSLLERFPRRHFILVGDSGERDPEIYGAIAREQPGRIIAIFIRDVTGEPLIAERYIKAFQDLPPPMVRVFAHPEAISDWRWSE